MTASKPKAPLTAYNLFFQLERKRILDGTDEDDLPITMKELAELAALHKQKKTEKRSHRRSHGKISFGDLARTVARRWKTVSLEDRSTLEQQARLEKIEYNRNLRAWRLAQEQNANQVREESRLTHQDPLANLVQGFQEAYPPHPCVSQAASSRLQELSKLLNQVNAAMTREIVSSISQAEPERLHDTSRSNALEPDSESSPMYVDHKGGSGSDHVSPLSVVPNEEYKEHGDEFALFMSSPIFHIHSTQDDSTDPTDFEMTPDELDQLFED